MYQSKHSKEIVKLQKKNYIIQEASQSNTRTLDALDLYHTDNKVNVCAKVYDKSCVGELQNHKCTTTRDLVLDQLNNNLNQVRENGIKKLVKLVQDLCVEKHCYKEKIDEVTEVIDERISAIKSDIDDIHLGMKNRLIEIRNEISKKLRSEIDCYKSRVHEMNLLVHKGLDALQFQTEDLEVLLEINTKLQDKLEYIKTLDDEITTKPPIFKKGKYSKTDFAGMIGKIDFMLNETTETRHIPIKFTKKSRKEPESLLKGQHVSEI